MNGGKTKSKIVKMMAMLPCTMLIAGSMFTLWGQYGAVSAEENSAKSLKLAKMEGTVQVTDSIGKKLPSFEQMTLKNGQHVKTDVASYAWINMDDSKTAKVGQKSDVDISQQKEDLEIRLNSGDVLVNVTKKITKTATVKIRTGTTVTGITGTVDQIVLTPTGTVKNSLLSGNCNMKITDLVTGEQLTIPVKAGQTVVQEKTGDGNVTVSVRPTTEADITSSTVDELNKDPKLAQEVQNGNQNLDVPGLIANADNIKATEEQNIKQQDDQVASGLKADQQTVNNSVQQTKDDDKKAAEEANRKHSDDDDEDEDEEVCEHNWTFRVSVSYFAHTSGDQYVLYTRDANNSDSEQTVTLMDTDHDAQRLHSSLSAIGVCSKCRESRQFTLNIDIDREGSAYTLSNSDIGYSVDGIVMGG
ncbi:MAG: hypothetical protein E7300_01765 [Lachnospiraceae bacterium]|nr:hypothetical protein [Lachnospiraceae bacterium]